jgi:tetratricopeptide (TPR) repeat protein
MTSGGPPPHYYTALAEQLERERSAAGEELERVQGAIAAYVTKEIPLEWRTLGFVMELNASVAVLLETDPEAAKMFGRLAIRVLAHVPQDSYPPAVRRAAEVTAWKELANVYRYLSDYASAHHALDSGEQCLADSLTSAYDLALVQFGRALVYSDQRRFDDAARVLEAAVDVFEEHFDAKQVAKCRLLQGMSAHRQGRLREACVIYKKTIEALQRTDDLATLASAYNNLGHAYTDLVDLAAAVEALHKSVTIFGELGMTAEEVRARAVLGRVLLAQKRYQQAREMFVDARLAFLRLGMPEEAGIVGLLLAEALVGLGDRGRVFAIIEEVANEFERAGLGERAAMALGYLKEMLDTLQASAATTHVREYMSHLRDEPMLAFVPLPPA